MLCFHGGSMKRRQLPLFRWSTLRPILLTLTLLACGCRILLAETGDELVAPNSNEAPAGRLQNGVLTIRIETAMGKWYPEENDGPALKVAAFREEGGRLSTPGPLLRVQEDTQIHVSMYNRLDQALTLHGLHSRPGDAKDILVVPSGERREVNFLAGAPGTY